MQLWDAWKIVRGAEVDRRNVRLRGTDLGCAERLSNQSNKDLHWTQMARGLRPENSVSKTQDFANQTLPQPRKPAKRLPEAQLYFCFVSFCKNYTSISQTPTQIFCFSFVHLLERWKVSVLMCDCHSCLSAGKRSQLQIFSSLCVVATTQKAAVKIVRKGTRRVAWFVGPNEPGEWDGISTCWVHPSRVRRAVIPQLTINKCIKLNIQPCGSRHGSRWRGNECGSAKRSARSHLNKSWENDFTVQNFAPVAQKKASQRRFGVGVRDADSVAHTAPLNWPEPERSFHICLTHMPCHYTNRCHFQAETFATRCGFNLWWQRYCTSFCKQSLSCERCWAEPCNVSANIGLDVQFRPASQLMWATPLFQQFQCKILHGHRQLKFSHSLVIHSTSSSVGVRRLPSTPWSCMFIMHDCLSLASSKN